MMRAQYAFGQNGGLAARSQSKAGCFYQRFEAIATDTYFDRTHIHFVHMQCGVWDSDFGSCAFVLAILKESEKPAVYCAYSIGWNLSRN